MAFTVASPDMRTHALSTLGIGTLESEDNITEALTALDTYKKKDPSKGEYKPSSSSLASMIGNSRSAIQSSWQRSDHETELL